jgi:DNA anti-recombination protein RmuC
VSSSVRVDPPLPTSRLDWQNAPEQQVEFDENLSQVCGIQLTRGTLAYACTCKVLTWYLASVRQKDALIAPLSERLREKDAQIAAQSERLREKDAQIAAQSERVRRLENEASEMRTVLVETAQNVGPRVHKWGECQSL